MLPLPPPQTIFFHDVHHAIFFHDFSPNSCIIWRWQVVRILERAVLVIWCRHVVLVLSSFFFMSSTGLCTRLDSHLFKIYLYCENIADLKKKCPFGEKRSWSEENRQIHMPVDAVRSSSHFCVSSSYFHMLSTYFRMSSMYFRMFFFWLYAHAEHFFMCVWGGGGR
jgi:hypothetical protein